MHHRVSTLPLVLTALLTAACTTIQEAPADIPRVEIEVDIAVEEGFRKALVNADPTLNKLVENAILEEADVGLRFYPVQTASYEGEHARPPYLMIVRAGGLDLMETESTEGGRRVSRVTASVGVRLERRRDNAPSLLVGQSTQSASLTPRDPSTAGGRTYHKAGTSVPLPAVSSMDVTESVRLAIRQCFARMLRAIDRELGQGTRAP